MLRWSKLLGALRRPSTWIPALRAKERPQIARITSAEESRALNILQYLGYENPIAITQIRNIKILDRLSPDTPDLLTFYAELHMLKHPHGLWPFKTPITGVVDIVGDGVAHIHYGYSIPLPRVG